MSNENGDSNLSDLLKNALKDFDDDGDGHDEHANDKEEASTSDCNAQVHNFDKTSQQNSIMEALKVLADEGAKLREGNFDGETQLPAFMEEVLQTMVSKEMLYPSLSEMRDKYPAWLVENADKIAPSDLDRYRKQLELISKVCAEFDTERESDSESMKKNRFRRIMETMQIMIEYGQPPEEFTENPAVTFDNNGIPIINPELDAALFDNADPSQCKID